MNGIISGNKLSEILQYIQRELTSVGYEEREVRSIIKIIVQDLLKISYARALTEVNLTISESQILSVHKCVKKLIKKEPIQYAIGFTWFCGLKFKVNKDVLIPRPETEELVFQIVDKVRNRPPGRIIDLGTGSGCIAIALKDKLPGWEVLAVDASSEAIEVANWNSKQLGKLITFIQQDIFEMNNINFQCDVVVSNPPYVLNSDKSEMQDQVLMHEPHMALFVPDDDPCIFYRHISQWAKDHLSEEGILAFEIHENYATEVALIMKEDDFQTKIVKDFQEKDRFVFGSR